MSLRARKARLQKKKNVARESGFDLRFANHNLPTYNALYDTNLRHFFENRRIQKQLYNIGLVDQEGRVIDLEKNKAKLCIIDQEFKNAERSELLRKKEEEEMRRRVQRKRHEALENSRRARRLEKMKQDRRIQKEILLAAKEALSVPIPKRKKKKKKKKGSRTAQSLPTPASAFPNSPETSSDFFLTAPGALDAASSSIDSAMKLEAEIGRSSVD